MHSVIVVTSWWSNCLALTCLHQLLDLAPRRELFVMQAGKSLEQMERFRQFLPKDVTELPYPDYLGPDDSAMREYLARHALRDGEGAWFFDHDTFLLAPADSFFESADLRFSKSSICLCTRSPLPGSGVTQPAYWLSPLRWPEGLSSFAPVPFEPRPYSRRPDLYRHEGKLTLPGKDTLVKVREELEALSMTGTFPAGGDDTVHHFLSSFPQHIHIGGLHLYTGPTQPSASMPPAFFDWRQHILNSFDAFFRNCPSEWLSIEDPELLRRHEEMMGGLRYGSLQGNMKNYGLSSDESNTLLKNLASEQLARTKPYKAAAPEQSISRIQMRLSSLGLSFVEEEIHGEGGCFSCCLKLVCDDRDGTVFQTMGKGVTNVYARASAYGEMVERIQNLAFYMMLMYPSQPETDSSPPDITFKYYPDEKVIVHEELRHGINRLSRNHSCSDDFIPTQSAIGAPFWNVFRAKAEYLPLRAFHVIVGSNGMCSGNTRTEALIHGICEVFERYVLKQLFLSPSSPPNIPFDLFAGHGIHEDLNRLVKNKGYDICVKDCSLGFRLPVIGLLIRDRYGQYAFHLGSDPSPITALERCLTEMCQGGLIRFKNSGELEGISGNVHDSEFWKIQLDLNIRSYSGHWPPATLRRQSDYPFQGFEHPVSESDEDDLNYLLKIIGDAGWDLLIRDNSFLDLPSYQIYIPGISEMTNALSDSFVRQYLAFDQKLHLLTNPTSVTLMQREEIVKAIEKYAMVAPSRQFRAAEYFMHYRQHPLASMSHETLKEFLLQPFELDRDFEVPECFECKTCWCASRCNYPFISTVWARLKQAMTSSSWDQSNLRYITEGNI